MSTEEAMRAWAALVRASPSAGTPTPSCSWNAHGKRVTDEPMVSRCSDLRAGGGRVKEGRNCCLTPTRRAQPPVRASLAQPSAHSTRPHPAHHESIKSAAFDSALVENGGAKRNAALEADIL